MKNMILSAGLALLLAGGYSCKGKNKDKDVENTVTPAAPTESNTPPSSGPVTVNPDDALRQGVKDATKDIKGLETRVEAGVIYLSGSISKEDNMRISPTLSSLHPKEINRTNLTVK